MAKLDKKGNKWYVRLWLRDQRRYKWIPTNSNNQKDNNRILKQYNANESLAVSGLQKLNKININESFEEWFSDKGLRIKSSTIKEYKLARNSFLKVVNGNRELSTLCPTDYRKWIKHMVEKVDCDPATTNGRQRSLKAFFRWCIDQKFIREMPFKIQMLKEGPKEPRVFTLDEVCQILEIADSEIMKSYIRFSYYSGLRLGTLNNTEWIKRDGKNYLKILRDKVEQNIGKILPVDARLKNDWVVITTNKWKRNRITKNFTRYAKLTGSYVKNRKTFHALRHSYGCEWINKGKPLAVLSKLLMHSSIKVTADYYVDANPVFFEEHVANA